MSEMRETTPPLGQLFMIGNTILVAIPKERFIREWNESALRCFEEIMIADSLMTILHLNEDDMKECKRS